MDSAYGITHRELNLYILWPVVLHSTIAHSTDSVVITRLFVQYFCVLCDVHVLYIRICLTWTVAGTIFQKKQVNHHISSHYTFTRVGAFNLENALVVQRRPRPSHVHPPPGESH